MIDKTDEDIVRQVQGGDVESFGVLVERYEEKMRRYARRFLFSGEDVKDVAQEVFMKAYINIQSFNPAKRFSPWVYRIAHNEFINSIKKKSRLPIFPFDSDVLFPHPIAPETADDEAKRSELKRMLDERLGKLDPKYREPLVLYYFEDMEYGEISEVLQIPVSTVGIRLRRGKEFLKKMISKKDE